MNVHKTPDDDEIPPERLVRVDGPTKLTDEQREKLNALAALPDDQIDHSDIPKITEIPSHAVIGKFDRADNERTLTDEQREKLKALAARPDEEIDFSDIPEVEFTDQVQIGSEFFRQFREGVNPEYDFSKGTRGRILPEEPLPEGKVRVTLVLDETVVDAFMEQADESGGKVRYHDLINEALKAWIAKRE